jgi:hypothetical protein
MHIHFAPRVTKSVVADRSDSSCLVDVRPGILERAILHYIACFSRGSRSVDVVRNLSGVDCGCHRRIPQSVHNVFDRAREINSLCTVTPCPPDSIFNGYGKVTAR